MSDAYLVCVASPQMPLKIQQEDMQHEIVSLRVRVQGDGNAKLRTRLYKYYELLYDFRWVDYANDPDNADLKSWIEEASDYMSSIFEFIGIAINNYITLNILQNRQRVHNGQSAVRHLLFLKTVLKKLFKRTRNDVKEQYNQRMKRNHATKSKHKLYESAIWQKWMQHANDGKNIQLGKIDQQIERIISHDERQHPLATTMGF